MVGVCLTLAPDVNLSLHSRKLGYSCWCSIFFSFCFVFQAPIWFSTLVNLSTSTALEKTFATSRHQGQDWGTATRSHHPQ